MGLKETKIVRYFYEAREELAKVAWPSRRQTLVSTLLVVGVSIGTAALLGALDFGLNIALEALLNR